MDFNKAFTAYDTVDGVRCQTTAQSMSQKDAALLAVRTVGLNQIADIRDDWFKEKAVLEMFRRRLEILKSA